MSRAWISTDDTGRTVYKFHQSWLSDTDLCLERARKGLVGELNDGPSDATSVGTAMHWAIEKCLLELRDVGEPLDLDECIDHGQAKFTEEVAHPDFVWKKRKDKGARSYLTRAIENWYDAILPKLDPWHIELSFGPYELYSDDKRVVQLGGTIDYVDRRFGLMDWKTGSPHSWDGKDWEKQRAAIQPTLYSWAFRQWLLENGHDEPEIPMQWHFVVMLDNNAVRKVKVERRPEDWAWLERKVRSVVTLIEADLPEWPRRDSENGLCSPKWCPNWSACKGADVHPAWPK